MKLLLVAFFALNAGQVAPAVSFTDQSGNVRKVPAQKPVLVIYDDDEGRKTNHKAKDLLGKLNSSLENQALVDVFPVADLAKWDWFPAKNFALKEIRQTAKDKKTTIYLDWKGEVRKAWGLAKGKSNLVLVGTDGKVLFQSQGECTQQQIDELVGILVKLGWRTNV
jgi:hypothetical protein